MRNFVIVVVTILILLLNGTTLMAGEITYTVKSGDTLWQIACNNGITVDYLKQINNVTSDFIAVGDELVIGYQTAVEDQSSDDVITYKVKPGDTLWKIANNNGITVDYLKQINNLSLDFISPGDELILSQEAGEPVSSDNISTYTIHAGDNLWKIASKFGLSVDWLKVNNNLLSDEIYIGDKLIVRLQNGNDVSRSGLNISATRLMEKAAEYLNTPYVYGGQYPGGFDCSGFVKYVFAQFGYNLPRTAASQFQIGQPVEKTNLLPGDLIFFKCHNYYIDHVGIYAGSNQFIHSSSPRSGGVIYTSLSEDFYSRSYAGAKRILR